MAKHLQVICGDAEIVTAQMERCDGATSVELSAPAKKFDPKAPLQAPWKGTARRVGCYILLQDEKRTERLMQVGDTWHAQGRDYRLQVFDAGRYALMGHDAQGAGGSGQVLSPIAGRVGKIHVAVGDRVALGQPVVILEAMKMENELRSTVAGVVKEIAVAVGQETEPKKLLIRIEPETA